MAFRHDNEIKSLVDLLEYRRKTHGHMELYRFLTNDGQSLSLSYHALAEQAKAIAVLLQRQGLQVGDRALLIYPPGLELIAAYFGCLYAGVIAVPMYPPLNEKLVEKIQAVMANAEPAVLLSTQAVGHKLKQLKLLKRAAQVPLLKQLTRRYFGKQARLTQWGLETLPWIMIDELSPVFAQDWQSLHLPSEHLAFLQYTSGSTSQPKGVMVSHGNLLHNLSIIDQGFEIGANERCVTWLPPYHDMGLIGGILQALYTGFPCVLMSPLQFLNNPYQWLKTISDFQATISGGPNFSYDYCVKKITEAQKASLDLSHWQLAFNGAEPIHISTLERFYAAFKDCGFQKKALYPCYGLAEATLYVSGVKRQYGYDSVSVSTAALGQHYVQLATASVDSKLLVHSGMAYQTVRIVNPETCQVCAANEVGEIWIHSASVAQGYWRRPEETAQTFNGRLADPSDSRPYLRTGDLGFIAQGQLYVTGRLKDLLELHGVNYYPQDIEQTVSVCNRRIRAGNCAAFGIEVNEAEHLVVVCEVESQVAPADYDAICQHIRQALSDHHNLPVYQIVLIAPKQLPKTTSGKVRRQPCKALWLSGQLPVLKVWQAPTWQFEEIPTHTAVPQIVPPDQVVSITSSQTNMSNPTVVSDTAQALPDGLVIEQWLIAWVSQHLAESQEAVDAKAALTSYGLDSIALIELMQALGEHLKKTLDPQLVVEYQTIRALAQAIAQGEGISEKVPLLVQEASASRLSSADLDEIPVLSFGQERLWFLQQLYPDTIYYNIGGAYYFKKAVDTKLLKLACQAILHRHESLRTIFQAKSVDTNEINISATEKVHAIVLPGIETPWQIEDITALASAEKATATQAFINQLMYTPYDLTQGPLIRFGWLQVSADEGLFVFGAHHIIFDGWSSRVLLNELKVYYDALQTHRRAELAPLALQYIDFAQRQRQRLTSPQARAITDFWRQELQGINPVLDLPTDKPHATQGLKTITRFSFSLDSELSHALEVFSQAQGVTMFTVLFSAYQLLLFQYSHQTDFCIGMPVLGREEVAFKPLIGFFVNILPMRARLPLQLTASEFISQVHQRLSQVYRHQDLDLAALINELNFPRDLSREALFQVMFLFQNVQTLTVDLGEANGEACYMESGQFPYDLSLEMYKKGGVYQGHFSYPDALFATATITRLSEHYQRLLTAMLRQPDQMIGALNSLSQTEQEQLLVTWNATERAYSLDKTIHQLFEAQAESTPDNIALVSENQHLTYRELNEQANQLAHYLIAQGIGPDQRVAVCLERSVELIVSLLGILKAGAAYLPLDPAYPSERMAYILANGDVRLVLTQTGLVNNLSTEKSRVWIALDKAKAILAQASKANPVTQLSADNLAYVIFTSGSTGKPKGVLVPHRGVVNLINIYQDWFNIAADDRFAQYHAHIFDAFGIDIWPALALGASSYIVPAFARYSPEALVKFCGQHQITLIDLPTALAKELFAADLPADLRLRVVKVGGEKVTQLEDKSYPFDIWNTYGPTETTIEIIGTRLYEAKTNTFCYDLSQSPPIGRLISNAHAYILSPDLALCPIGAAGELHLTGPGLARGYINHPELTAEKFIANPFATEGDLATGNTRLYKTGDLCRWLADGSLEYIGRIDQQVKIRGFRIELGEIEARLKQHPALKEAVVLAREDEPGNKRLVAYYILHDANESQLSVSELRNYVSASLPEYMIPSAFMALTAFPLTPNGKLDRKGLPAPEFSTDSQHYVAPRTPTEQSLVEIWQAILHQTNIGVSDNFFERGGHSLLATQIVSRIREKYQVELPLQQVFKTPTVAGLADYLDTATRQAEQENILVVDREGKLPLSFAQQRLWFIDQLEPGNAQYNVPITLKLTGKLNSFALAASLNKLIERHEVLRTTFIMEGTEVIQCIAEVLTLALIEEDVSGQSSEQIKARILTEVQQSFVLSQGPLLRATLLQLSQTEYLFLLNIHHSVCDGWSLTIIANELMAFYEAEVTGKPAQLKPLTIQYADFSVWQRHYLEETSEIYQRQIRYWQARLADSPILLELPTDYPRPAQRSIAGDSIRFQLSSCMVEDLKVFCLQTQTTLFMMLLATFYALLYRYSGQTDIVVGSPIANRNHKAIEPLVGFFVNTLALRAELNSHDSFKLLLQQVKQRTLEAYEHQDVPFERLVELLKVERSLSYNPLFQVMFILQNNELPVLTLPELTLTVEPLDYQISKFDLIFNLEESPTGIVGNIEFATALFAKDSIARLVQHFITLLGNIIKQPEIPIAELPLLTPSEQTQLVRDWNSTQRHYPKEKTLHQLFEAQVEKTPANIATIFEDQQLTYKELNEKANQLAHYLVKQGVGPDQLVAVCLERSLELVISLLAILKTGGAYVPLDVNSPQERLLLILDDTQAALIISNQTWSTLVRSANKPILEVDTQAPALATYPVTNLSIVLATPYSLSYVIYTSGSTGKPKGVGLAHKTLVNLLHWQSVPALSPQRITQFANIVFDVSLQEILFALLNGYALYLVPKEIKQSIAAFVQFVEANAITQVFLPTIVLEYFAQEALNLQVKLTALSAIIVAGEALKISQSIQQFFSQYRHIKLINHYGPSESHVVSALTLEEQNQPWPIHPSIGKAIANTQWYLLDSQLQPVPVGVYGELYLGGVNLARGYINRPELTAEKFIANPFATEADLAAGNTRLYKTGDLCRWLPDGNIEYIGRIDNQVKVRGFRIELGEIESALMLHHAIKEAVVITWEDEPGNKRLIAYYILHDANTRESQLLLVSELRNYLRKNLPEYMIPSVFMALAAFPLTPNGKLDRKALPAPESFFMSNHFIPPRDTLELKLAHSWQTILKLSQIGIVDNFFEIGGHSLLAVQLIQAIKQNLGVELPIASLFAAPTIEHMAEMIRNQDYSHANSHLVEIQPKGHNKPIFAIHPVGGNVLCYYGLSQALGQEWPFYGLQQLEVVKDKNALAHMAESYIEAIRKLQPQGPYYLLGWSMGGIIAHEIAYRLECNGESACIVMVDSALPTTSSLDDFDYTSVIVLFTFAKDLAGRYGQPLFVTEEELKVRAPHERLAYLFKKAKEQKLFASSTTLNQFEKLLVQGTTNFAALEQHQPKLIQSPIILFIAGKGIGIERIDERINQWSHYSSQKLITHVLEEDHYSIMSKSGVEILAKLIKKVLREKD